MSQMEDNVVFNRNKQKKFSFYSKKIEWGEKERYSPYSHKSAREKCFSFEGTF